MSEQPSTALLEEFHRRREVLMDWLALYDGYGKTYRDFRDDYAVAPEAQDFLALMARPDLPAEIHCQAMHVYAAIYEQGFVAGDRTHPATGRELAADDLIQGHQIPGGHAVLALAAEHPDQAVQRILQDVEHGPAAGRPPPLPQRIADGRAALAMLQLPPATRAAAEARLSRIGEAGTGS